MKPARYKVRVHGVIFCVSVLSAILLFAFDVIGRGHLLPVTVFLFSFGEVVLVSTRYCGPALEQRIRVIDPGADK